VFIAVDIGGTKTEVAIGEERVEKFKVIPTPAEFENFLSSLFLLIERVGKGKKIKAIGISAPGPLDPVKGLIFPSPNLKWKEAKIKEVLEKRFTLPVFLENDANLAGLGECFQGAGKGADSVFYITVSTGIGGAFILQGKIYQGASFDAGEIGHTVVLDNGPRCNCGRKGCLEALSSGTAIAKRAKRGLKRYPHSLIWQLVENRKELVDAQVVVKAVRAGDEFACKIWEESCRFLALGVANMISLLNPQKVIIGGGISKAGEILFRPLRKMVKEIGWKRAVRYCRIEKAKLRNPAIVGALVYAKSKLSSS